jgi:biopolymer transport protein ExbD
VKLTPTQRVAALIPTASMADIAFLLIIFFMVTTGYEVDRTPVDLPKSSQRTEAVKDAAVVVLARDPDTGALSYRFSDGVKRTSVVGGPEDIYLEASRLIYRDATRQFVLKADGSVHFEKVDELLDRMRRGGVQNVLLLTQQRTVSGSAP